MLSAFVIYVTQRHASALNEADVEGHEHFEYIVNILNIYSIEYI